MKQVAYTISGTGRISACIDNKPLTVETDHPNYRKVLEVLKSKEWNKLTGLLDLAQGLKEYGGQNIEINDGAIMYAGEPLHNSLTVRILKFMREDLPVEPLIKFLENLLKNPSSRAVNELYNFLEVGEMPITEDGCFLAFKNVRANFHDIHSGKFDNSVGQKPWMPRNLVDENKDQTCSTGLHFCSLAYLPNFSDTNGHTMIVKVNPSDVVSVPSDYANTKARANTYEVVAEYEEDWRNRSDNGFDEYLYSSNGGDWDEDSEEIYGTKPCGHKFYNKRNDKGQFIKN